MKAKDCKKCAFCVHVYGDRYFCRKLGMTVYPNTNGQSPCCWYKEERLSEDENRNLPDLWP